jgi:hypothetical protein
MSVVPTAFVVIKPGLAAVTKEAIVGALEAQVAVVV